MFDEKDNERKGTPVKGGTSDAEGKSNSRGHLKVNVGDGKFIYLHRIIQSAKDGKAVGEDVIVRHADDQKDGHNNSVANLSLGTRADNAKDRSSAKDAHRKMLEAAAESRFGKRD